MPGSSWSSFYGVSITTNPLFWSYFVTNLLLAIHLRLPFWTVGLNLWPCQRDFRIYIHKDYSNRVYISNAGSTYRFTWDVIFCDFWLYVPYNTRIMSASFIAKAYIWLIVSKNTILWGEAFYRSLVTEYIMRQCYDGHLFPSWCPKGLGVLLWSVWSMEHLYLGLAFFGPESLLTPVESQSSSLRTSLDVGLQRSE